MPSAPELLRRRRGVGVAVQAELDLVLADHVRRVVLRADDDDTAEGAHTALRWVNCTTATAPVLCTSLTELRHARRRRRGFGRPRNATRSRRKDRLRRASRAETGDSSSQVSLPIQPVPPRALATWCAMKCSSISPGVMRRIDGVGGLADAVRHSHRSDLQGEKRCSNFTWLMGSRWASRRENHDRKRAIGLFLEMAPKREQRNQLGPQLLAALPPWRRARPPSSCDGRAAPSTSGSR